MLVAPPSDDLVPPEPSLLEFVLPPSPTVVPPPIEAFASVVIISSVLKPPEPSPPIAPCPAAPPVPTLFSVTVFLVVLAHAKRRNCAMNSSVGVMWEDLFTVLTVPENLTKRQGGSVTAEQR